MENIEPVITIVIEIETEEEEIFLSEDVKLTNALLPLPMAIDIKNRFHFLIFISNLIWKKSNFIQNL